MKTYPEVITLSTDFSLLCTAIEGAQLLETLSRAEAAEAKLGTADSTLEWGAAILLRLVLGLPMTGELCVWQQIETAIVATDGLKRGMEKIVCSQTGMWC